MITKDGGEGVGKMGEGGQKNTKKSVSINSIGTGIALAYLVYAVTINIIFKRAILYSLININTFNLLSISLRNADNCN